MMALNTSSDKNHLDRNKHLPLAFGLSLFYKHTDSLTTVFAAI
jgi:hypothetical protein